MNMLGVYLLLFLAYTWYNRKRTRPIKKPEGSLQRIVGLASVKEELRHYMDFIKDKKKYEQFKIRLPRGILLIGPPGTGKTLLVKSLAASIDIPVIHTSGSEFVEKYVGVGASRVRDLFERARREKAGCIIFIDEIDSIGKERNSGSSTSEHDSTLNQLLVEMDGFESADNIIVFGATNSAQNLDSALMRSGRFDKKVFFDAPNKQERAEMFLLDLSGIPVDGDVKADALSVLTPGLTGADITNICNQAKINMVMAKADHVGLAHIQTAIDEILIGREKPERKASPAELRRIAFHEAGHAIMSFAMKHTSAPIKVSILPRGEAALGFSQSKPEDKKLFEQSAITSRLCVLLGGRVAEHIMYGDYSSGAHDDIEKVTTLVRQWFLTWGMDAELGPLNYWGEKLDESMMKRLQDFVKGLEQFTYKILKANKRYIIRLGELLLEKETIVSDDIERVLPKELKSKHSV